MAAASAQNQLLPGTHEVEAQTEEWYQQPKHVWILTYSGKPIFSRYGDESLLSAFMGMLMGVISIYEDGNDRINYIVAGRTKFVFLLRGPIYLVMASSLQESAWQMKEQLTSRYRIGDENITGRKAAEFRCVSTWLDVYAHLLFVATARIKTVLAHDPGADIRPLLDGHKPAMRKLLDGLDAELTYMLQSYVCVPLSWELRTRLTSLLKSARDSDMVYAVLFVGRRIVTYVEPRSFSLHVDDMLLLLDWMDTNLSQSTEASHMFRSLCLPNLDTDGLVYVYAAMLCQKSKLGLISISTDESSLETLSKYHENVNEQLASTGVLVRVHNELLSERGDNTVRLTSGFLASELAIPELWHFVFRSASMQQLIIPSYSKPAIELERACHLYRGLLHRLQTRSECFVRTAGLAGIAVRHSKFTVLCLLSPMTDYWLATQIVQTVVTRWLPAHKDRLCLLCQNTW